MLISTYLFQNNGGLCMKKGYTGVRQTTAALLSLVMILGSLPQGGIYAYAADAACTTDTAYIADPTDTACNTDTAYIADATDTACNTDTAYTADPTDAAYTTLSPGDASGGDDAASQDGSDSAGIPETSIDLSQTRAADYPTDTTLGYNLSDLVVSPGSYAARFAVRLSSTAGSTAGPTPTIYSLRILYTTDENLKLLPSASKASESDISEAGLAAAYLKNPSREIKYDENNTPFYELAGDFAGDYANYGAYPLKPETTYYYRIAFYSSSEYYFLTGAEQFTTGAPLETTAVTITSLETVAVGYNFADFVWTVENPNQEYMDENYLYVEQIGSSYEGAPWRDPDSNEIVPGKYYASIRMNSKTRTVIPKVLVYTGASERTSIVYKESLTVEAADINQADTSAQVSPTCDTVRIEVQVSPQMHPSDSLYAQVFYRKAGDSDWAWSAFEVSAFSYPGIISNLSPETTYEYYIVLTPSNLSDISSALWSDGSAPEPLTFTTAKVIIYEDSLFPDDVFRNYLKARFQLSEDEPLTSRELDSITLLYCDWESGDDDAIRSVEGIQYLPHLTSLTLRYHELSEMPDLSSLKELKHVELLGNKILSGLTADKLPEGFLETHPTWLAYTAKWQRYPVSTPSQAEINARYAGRPYQTDMTNTYAVKPSVTSPYAAGRLSDDSMDNALNALNFCRYVAGISSDVVLDDTYIERAQTGALLNAVNNVLTHTPGKPKDCPDDLYKLGLSGCLGSNLAAGYSNITDSLIRGWLDDGDATNIDRVGHRRWALNPAMTATGFGAVGAYSAMIAQDHDNPSAISDFVAWPAQNMPTDLMTDSGYPWSVNLGTDYAEPEASAVSVTLRNTATGKTWHFSEKTSDFNGNYFAVNNGGYGMGKCIIFRPKISEISYTDGSRFEVSVSGLKDRFGKDKSLSYTVDFFTLGKVNISIRLNKSSLKLSPGESETLIATVQADNDSDISVTWSSTDPDVATVDENGKVTAVSAGDTEISASYKGKKATCKVSVRDYSISRTELAFDLAEGVKTETLTVSDGVKALTDVTWSSANEGVAAVSKKGAEGIVTPKGAGTAQIRAQVKDGPLFVCTVTVRKDILTSISLNLQECTLEKDAVKHLKVYFVPGDTTLSREVVWTSDKPEVASVDAFGKVTALSRGAAVITASVAAPGTSTDSQATGKAPLTAQCKVTVTETAAPAQDNIPSGLSALTNVQTKLSDVSLKDYEGWEWANGEISLSQFAGMQEKSFAAVYRREGYADYKTALRVSLATLNGLSIVTDKATLYPNETTRAAVQWKLSGSEAVLSEHASALQWSSSSGHSNLIKSQNA